MDEIRLACQLAELLHAESEVIPATKIVDVDEVWEDFGRVYLTLADGKRFVLKVEEVS